MFVILLFYIVLLQYFFVSTEFKESIAIIVLNEILQHIYCNVCSGIPECLPFITSHSDTTWQKTSDCNLTFEQKIHLLQQEENFYELY